MLACIPGGSKHLSEKSLIFIFLCFAGQWDANALLRQDGKETKLVSEQTFCKKNITVGQCLLKLT